MRCACQTTLKIVAVTICIAVAAVLVQLAASSAAEKQAPADQQIGLFDGMQNGDLQVRYVPKNDHEAQIIIKNNTQQPLSVKLPDAFAGVPVLAQAAGGTSRSSSSSRSGSSSSSSGGNQSSGGSGSSSRGGGGGGGVFSVAPEAVGRVKVPILCLEHGKDDPNERVPYQIVPIESYTTDGRVQELLKLLGTGQIDPRAAQAAAWHFTNNMSWNELAAKKLNHLGQPYFTKAELAKAMALVARSEELAKANPPMVPATAASAPTPAPADATSPGDKASPADVTSPSARYSE